MVKRILFSLQQRDSQEPGGLTIGPEAISSLRFMTMNQRNTATLALTTNVIDDVGGPVSSSFGFIPDDAQYWDERDDTGIHERDAED